MTVNVFSMAAFSEAEMFNAFCEHEYQYGSEIINREYYFHAFGILEDEDPFHELMAYIGERALASDNPSGLLARYEGYLDRCSIRIQDLIDVAARHRAMSREIVMLVNRKQRVRVPAGTAATSSVA
jgi:hypothetical protein